MRSPDGAKRNPVPTLPRATVVRLTAHFASLHAGYDYDAYAAVSRSIATSALRLSRSR